MAENLGKVVGLLSCWLLTSVDGKLRWNLTIGAAAPLLGLAVPLFVRLPESPSWLCAVEDHPAALESLEEQMPIVAAKLTIQTYRAEARPPATWAETIRGVLQGHQELLAGLVVGACVAGFGLPIMLQYAGLIMKPMMDQSQLQMLSLTMYILRLLIELPVVLLCKSVSSRDMLLISSGCCAASVAVMAVFINLEMPPLTYAIITCVFIVSFSLGMGPLQCMVIPALYPNHLRAKGVAASYFVSYAVACLLLFTFPLAMYIVGGQVTFYALFMGALLSYSGILTYTVDEDVVTERP